MKSSGSLLTEISKLNPGDHLCSIYETEEEHRAVLTLFLRQGLERNEKVVYVVDTHTGEAVLEYLPQAGLEPRPFLEKGQLVILSAADTYLRDGTFDPERMISFLRHETDRALSEGYPALRVTGEMSWALKGLPGSELLIDYESRLNNFIPSSRCLALCQYDRRRFSPPLLLQVLATHPIVIIGTEEYENFHYIPPESFLARDFQKAVLDHCIDGLRARKLVKAGEDALRESEEQFRALFENSMDGILRTMPDGTILGANPAACEMLGRTEEEIRKEGRDGVVDASDPRLPILLAERSLRGVSIGELTFVRKDGTKFPVDISSRVYKDRFGNARTSMVFRDITERKRAESALVSQTLLLKESERKYRVLVANAEEAIFVAQDEIVKFPNPKALEMTGYSAEELAGVKFSDLIHPEDRSTVVERHIDRLRGGTPPETYPFRIVKKAGGEIWALLTAVLVEWEGRPGVLCFLRDITKERNLEAQFRQAQKMEAVGRLAGGIAHDFNNLLTVTIGYCDLALARVGAQDPLRRDLEEIRKSSDRCAALTRQLLAFSRKQILVPKVINLGDVVADMDKMLRRLIGEDIDLVSVRGEDLWNVKADPGQIGQVIVNLAVNSRDAMIRGGKLTIGTENVVLDEFYTRAHQYVIPGSYVMLAVSDTGRGMDAGTTARIFEPFFTTKEKGTGLGLSTVYGIVKQSGGYINVYSEPGIGTTFKMYFPRVEETVTGIPGAGPVPSEEYRGSESVLVVEDDDSVREMIREILAEYGYDVLEARSGREAVDLCSRRRGTIHMMLTDVVMPGMNGVELSKRLAPMQPEMKVLIMSGYTADAIAHQGMLDPGIAFLQKPFAMDSLAHKVREVLDSGPAKN